MCSLPGVAGILGTVLYAFRQKKLLTIMMSLIPSSVFANISNIFLYPQSESLDFLKGDIEAIITD